MRIDSGFPKPKEFKDNELKTLEFIDRHPQFFEKFPNLFRKTQMAIPFLKYNRGGEDIIFKLESHIDSRVEHKMRRICFGGIVSSDDNNNYSCFSYYFLLTEKNRESSKLLRKFHFDYAPIKLSGGDKHPLFHLQYCGKLSPALREAGYKDKALYPWLSLPRIPFQPMSLAILLNFILKEFCEYSIRFKITESAEWRRLVKNNERKILAPFFERCHYYTKASNHSTDPLSDLYYVR